MVVTLYVLLIAAVVLYSAGFLYETLMSFLRLGTAKKELYPHASWEVIHTTLVLAFATFMITHGPMLPELSRFLLVPFMLALLGFFVRATFQVLIFFGRRDSRQHNLLDWLFALSHVAILLPFLYAVISTTIYLMSHPLNVVTDMLGWFLPGLIAGVVICLAPIIYVLKHREY